MQTLDKGLVVILFIFQTIENINIHDNLSLFVDLSMTHGGKIVMGESSSSPRIDVVVITDKLV